MSSNFKPDSLQQAAQTFKAHPWLFMWKCPYVHYAVTFVMFILVFIIFISLFVNITKTNKVNRRLKTMQGIEGFDSAISGHEYSRYPAGVTPGTTIMGEIPQKVNVGGMEVENPNYVRKSQLWSPTDQNILNEQVWTSKSVNQ